MTEDDVMFPCDDISLEGVLTFPDGSGPFPLVVICHPHPLYGGSMDNNVVYAARKGLIEKQVASLIFNFRGVGRSSGTFGDGIGERDDVSAALSFASRQSAVDETRLGICGYSFGTMVCIPTADGDDRVQALAGISPFFVEPGLLKNYAKPKLFMCGASDEFINPSEIESIVGQLPEPTIYEIVPQADHFWGGFERELQNKIGSFFSSALTERGES